MAPKAGWSWVVDQIESWLVSAVDFAADLKAILLVE